MVLPRRPLVPLLVALPRVLLRVPVPRLVSLRLPLHRFPRRVPPLRVQLVRRLQVRLPLQRVDRLPRRPVVPRSLRRVSLLEDPLKVRRLLRLQVQRALLPLPPPRRRLRVRRGVLPRRPPVRRREVLLLRPLGHPPARRRVPLRSTRVPLRRLKMRLGLRRTLPVRRL